MKHSFLTHRISGIRIIQFLCILACYLCCCYFASHYEPLDDAFISFRYARNLTDGNGLVFNPGEHVEGYTNFLWVIASAFFIALGTDPGISMRIVGGYFGLCTLLVAWTAIVRTGNHERKLLSSDWVWIIVLASNPLLAYQNLNGLETGLYTFLLMAGSYIATTASGSYRRISSASLLFCLAALTRPEALLLLAGIGLSVILWSRAGAVLTRAFFWLLPIVLVLLPHQLWRLFYYGQWFPNTFYVKSSSLSLDVPDGYAYLVKFLTEAGAMGLVLFPLLLVFFLPWNRIGSIYALTALLEITASVVTGGDHMPFYRFLVPTIPLLICALASLPLIPLFSNIRWLRWVTLGIAVSISIHGIYCFNFHNMSAESESRWSVMWFYIGKHLGAHLPPETTIALSPIGIIPYYTGFVTYDLLGLTDRYIAHLPPGTSIKRRGHQKHDAQYILSRKPDYLILSNGIIAPGLPDQYPWHTLRKWEADFLDSELFLGYEMTWAPLESDRGLVVFKRKNQ